MLPWEQVLMKMRAGRLNQLAPPHGPINTTPAAYIHERKVPRLHLRTPLQTFTEHVQARRTPGSLWLGHNFSNIYILIVFAIFPQFAHMAKYCGFFCSTRRQTTLSLSTFFFHNQAPKKKCI